MSSEPETSARVLLLDADPLVQRTLAALLPRVCAEVAGSATEALAMLGRGRDSFHALVADVQLRAPEDRSSLCLVENLRAFDEPIGIVLLSRSAGLPFADDAGRAGADFVLRKADLDGPSLRFAIDVAVAAHSGDLVEPRKTGLPTDVQRRARDFQDSDAALLIAAAERDYRLAMAAKAAVLCGKRGALEQMAAQLGFSAPTLRPYVVFARLDEATIRDLFVGARNAQGKPLTARHGRALARLPAAARARWKERALAESLTAEELERRIAAQRRRAHRATAK